MYIYIYIYNTYNIYKNNIYLIYYIRTNSIVFMFLFMYNKAF